MSPSQRSLAELNFAVVLLGLVPLFAKWLPLDPASIIFYRCALGAAAMLAILAWSRRPIALASRGDYARMLFAGVLLGVHFATYFAAIQASTVAVAIAATFTFPVMTVLVEPFVMGGRLRPLDVALAVLAFLGVALVVGAGRGAESVISGVAWGLLSAVIFTARNVLSRKWFQAYPGTQTMLYQMAGAAACLAALATPPGAIEIGSWGLLLVLAVVFTAGAHSLFVGSMRHLPAKTNALVASLQPVYAIAAAAALLGEIPTVLTCLGAAMVVGVALVEGVRAPAPAKDA